MSDLDADQTISEGMEALRERFHEGLSVRMAEIDEHWSRLSQGDGDTRSQLKELILRLHRMAGAALMFEHDRLAAAARSAERLLELHHLSDGRTVGTDTGLESAMDAVKNEISRLVASDDEPELD